VSCAAPRAAGAAAHLSVARGAISISPASPSAASPAALAAVVSHELVHAFDTCRARVDRCEHLACTEVRAANLSGECNGGGARADCVRRSAVASVRAHGGCEARGGAEVGVAAVWAACMADRAPFEGGAWRPAGGGGGGGGGGKPQLIAPHLVDARAGLRPSRGL